MVLNDSYYEITYQISFIKIRIWGKPLKKEEQHLVQSGDKKGINRLFSSDIYPARRLKIRIIKKKIEKINNFHKYVKSCKLSKLFLVFSSKQQGKLHIFSIMFMSTFLDFLFYGHRC